MGESYRHVNTRTSDESSKDDAEILARDLYELEQHDVIIYHLRPVFQRHLAVRLGMRVVPHGSCSDPRELEALRDLGVMGVIPIATQPTPVTVRDPSLHDVPLGVNLWT